MQDLTPGEQEVLDFIRVYVAKEGHSPTVHHTRQCLHKTTSMIKHRLRALKEKGYLMSPINWLWRMGLVLLLGPVAAFMLAAAVLTCSLGWYGVVIVVASVSMGSGLLLLYRVIKQEHKDA